jgi:monoamine oxidase
MRVRWLAIRPDHLTQQYLTIHHIMLFTPQVVIVGAGLSGLRAASQIRDAGLSYVVVEAMNRPGGKVLSASVSVNGSEDAAVELGAAWINDSSQSKIYELALEYGIDLVKQPVQGLSLEEDASGISSGPMAAYHPSVPLRQVQVVS